MFEKTLPVTRDVSSLFRDILNGKYSFILSGGHSIKKCNLCEMRGKKDEKWGKVKIRLLNGKENIGMLQGEGENALSSIKRQSVVKCFYGGGKTI